MTDGELTEYERANRPTFDVDSVWSDVEGNLVRIVKPKGEFAPETMVVFRRIDEGGEEIGGGGFYNRERFLSKYLPHKEVER